MDMRQDWNSAHAARRMQKRVISKAYVDWLLDFGRPHPAGEGCTSFSFDKRGWRRFESYVGPMAATMRSLRNAYIVVASDGTLVTAA